MTKKNPYGDDAGTRVGKPDTPKRANMAGAGPDKDGNTGAGKESTGGVPMDGKAEPSKGRKSGSLEDQGVDKESGYGGSKGNPKTSRDQR
jgi:hypothetical protein